MSKTKRTPRENTGIFAINAGVLPGLWVWVTDGNRYPERTQPNKNTRFGPKDAPHEPAWFGPSRVFLFLFTPGGAPERRRPARAV
jgi:hypothetical protein